MYLHGRICTASFRKYVKIVANSLGPSGDTRVLPLASVKHTRPNLKAKCDWVVGALFRYSDLCAQGVSKSMKIGVWRDQKSSKIEVWGVFGWLGVSLAKFGSGFLGKFSPGYAQDGLSEH